MLLFRYIPATLLFLFLAGCSGENQSKDSGQVISSLPEEIATSDLFTLVVNGQPVPVEKLIPTLDVDTLPEWFRKEAYVNGQEVHVGDFSTEGEISVQIHVKVPFDSVAIRPFSRSIVPEIDGRTISFTLPGPDKLYILIDNFPELCLFGNPLEQQVPELNQKEVIFFGPGIHTPGYIELQDNQEIYLAPGAIVYGGIRGDGVSHVKIHGRGILDGDNRFKRMVMISNSRNIVVEGITIRNSVGWTNNLINCDNVTYDGVKVISFGNSGDGINPIGSRNVEIRNCFLRCTDDCIAIKSPDSTKVIEDIRIIGNTLIGYAFSDGITIGFETNGPAIRDVLVQDCDILMSRGGSRVDGHSAFSIICDGPADIHNITYDNIRVEAPVPKLFELHVTDGTLYGVDSPGKIRNVLLKNIRWMSKEPIILRGQGKNNNVSNVTFENCYVAGNKMINADSSIVTVGPFVEGITFR